MSLEKPREAPPRLREVAQELPAGPFDGVLRQILFHADSQRGTIVGITSTLAGEGKTLAVAEISERLSYSARSDRPVLTVDCAEFNVHIHRASGDDHLALRPVQISPRLQFLHSLEAIETVGISVREEGLSGAMDSLRRRFTFVVLDLAPLPADPIALDLAREVDLLYLVVRANSTPVERIRQAIELIGREHVDGVILNDARPLLPGWLKHLVS